VEEVVVKEITNQVVLVELVVVELVEQTQDVMDLEML
tara:strand:+ start:184 stop:294 length:111 start_codon:yes stop_codon:yes gene_type:complete